MVSRRGMAIAGLAALAVGCSHAPGQWVRVESEHFRIHTDQSAHDYEWVLEHLEDVHDGLRQSFFDNGRAPTLEVFLFGDGEFHDLVGLKWGGMFMGEHGKGGILCIYTGGDPAFLDRSTAHELAHGFIAATFHSVPPWFHEGFASYLESIIVEANGDRVWFGSLGSDATVNAAQGQVVPIAKLFSMHAGDFYGAWERSHYATAWSLFHYIEHGEEKKLRPRFDDFAAAVAAEGNNSLAGPEAWRRVFPEVPLPELDGRLRDHVNAIVSKHRDSRLGFRFTRPTRSEPRVSPADMAHVDQVRARMRAHPPDK